MKTYHVNKEGYYGEFVVPTFPKFSTVVSKSCKMSISMYSKANRSGTSTTTCCATM